MNYTEVRQQLYGVVQKGVAAGLIRSSAGNFSIRTPDGYVAITPASIKYDQLKPEEIEPGAVDANLCALARRGRNLENA